MNILPYAHIIWILPLLLLIIHIGSPRFLGTMGSARTGRILENMLEKNRYSLLHDVRLPSGGGSFHADHILVSQFGVHVIDSIYRKGLIAGTESQDRWRHKNLGRWRHFANPVHSNRLKAEALARLLDLPLSKIHSIVVVDGHSGFKGAKPMKVIAMHELIARIRTHSQAKLTPEEADNVLLKLQDSVLKPGFVGRKGHWKLLRGVLLILFFSSVYFVFKQPINSVVSTLRQQINISMAPEKHDQEGKLKSETQLWENSLICAHSIDTDRCSCYEPSGNKAELSHQRCKELAQKGSVLQR